MKRRNFLQKAMLPMAGVAIPSSLQFGKLDFSELPGDLRILFQGDSITDAGRDRGRYYANNTQGLGNGYVYQIVAELLGQNPTSDLQCFNRGISGHKVYQLADRWDIDCVGLTPDVLSILIGVNDFWHMINGRYDGTAEIYENDYRKLLKETREALPGIKLIICEPFAVKGGTAIDEKWSAFDDYGAIAGKLAKEFGASFVPFQEVFDKALEAAPASYWCPDGVHPSIAGAYLMKKAWLEAFHKLMMG